ncbi:hypothetical protein INT48_009019 [Thamnidium elegans]|uniref:Uncharacterized protein n=1 Tax=Thamnidium elegans TaxID=101142 RepID=A0A8H7SZQ3_9FUNG|nr:hypothetical protein INT48_009019 [Thamnidium elegans]
MATLFLLCSTISRLVRPKEPSQCQTLTDMFETARSYFYNRNYIESYRLFFYLEHTHALKSSSCAWYQIHCLIGLGHWNQAIKKCHDWVQLEPTVSQWYFICSEIYMNRLDFTLAWEELNKASAIIPAGDDAYQEICFKKRMTLEGKYLGILRKDILDFLPYDITLNIFNCLDLDSLSSQLELKTIYLYLNRAKRTGITKLSIRHQQVVDGDSVLMALANYDCCKLNTLVISDILCTPGLFFNVLEYIGSSLKKLQWGGVSIRLNDIIYNLPKISTQLTHLTVHDCFTSLHDVQLQTGALHRLEYFGETFPPPFLQSIQSLPKLNYIQYLKLESIHGLTACHLANVLVRCPALVKLSLIRCLVNIIPVFNILRITCPKLRYFEYERNRYCQQFDVFQHTEERRLANRAIVQQLGKQKNMMIKNEWVHVEIRLTNMLTDSMVQNILYLRDGLEVLDLSGNMLLSDIALTKQPLKALRILCLKECYGITFKGLECIIRQSPLLEEIDLSCLSVINNDILYALAKCARLRKVNFSYCKLSRVSSDAIKYFIDQRKETLQQCILDYTVYVSTDVLMYTIKNLKRGTI